MITPEYQEIYKNIFQDCLKNNQDNFYDEAGLPSYMHRNPLMSWVFWQRLDRALALAGNIKNARVLDFGCGNGVILKYLKDQNCRITGCDNKYFELTKKICRELNVEADIYEDFIQIREKKFDLIFALDVFEHIADLQPYLKKMNSLMQANSRLIISGPTENCLYKMGRFLAGFKGRYHLRNIYDIEAELNNCGFMKEQSGDLFPIFRLFRISLWRKAGA